MRSYNQQIEDAYAASKRQGDMMRNPQIERSSGQDRRNRYRNDRYQFPEQHVPYNRYNDSEDRTDRYGYERSNIYNDWISDEHRDQQRYPETYRSAMDGYKSIPVGPDRGRRNYNEQGGRPDFFTSPKTGEHKGKGPKSYKRSDDRILEEINERMCDNPYLDASDIEVSVKNGDVILTGHVEDREAKRLAAEIGEEITGVENVENRLHVKVRGI